MSENSDDPIYQRMLVEGWKRPDARKVFDMIAVRTYVDKRLQNQKMSRLVEIGKALEGK